MEKDVLARLKMNSRDEAVAFMKRLWTLQPTDCPICKNATLEPLHKKAKKSSSDWKCPSCGEIFRLINILYELND